MVENSSDDLLLISTVRSASGTQKDTLQLNGSGSFKHLLSAPKRSRLLLSYGKDKVTLIIEDGKKSHVKFKSQDLDNSLEFNGDFSNENQFLVDYKKNSKTKNSLSSKEVYSLGEDKFIDHLNAERETNSGFLKKLAPSLDQSFVNEKKGEIISNYGSKILTYKRAHNYYVPEDTSLTESFDYKKYLRSMDFTSEEYLGSSSYVSFLSNLTSTQAVALMGDEEEEYDDIIFKYTETLFKNDKVARAVQLKLLENSLRYGGITESSDVQFNSLKSTSDDISELEDIIAIRNKWIPLAKGQPAPIFNGKTLKGKEKSLTDYRGKFVYLDVWATWCGPCRAEIPSLKQLEKDFAKQDVVFMSVSIDSKDDPWKEMVKEEKLKGVQLFTEDAWNSKLCKSYNVRSIPRFILIDPAGKIVTVNAPRPSGKADELIKSELNNWSGE